MGRCGNHSEPQGIRRRFQGVAITAIASAALVVGIAIGFNMINRTKPAPATTGLTDQAAVVPAAPARLTAEVSLVRRVGDREEPLAPGARIAPDQRLSLLVKGTDSMYVYVLNEDSAGEVNGLFPIRGLAPANPLERGMRHRLPGDLGPETVYWNVTSAGGTESIVAIGSRKPIASLEQAMAEIPKRHRIRFGRVNPMALRSLRGIGEGSALPPPQGEAKRRLNDALEALKAEGQKSGDLWVWSIELRNP